MCKGKSVVKWFVDNGMPLNSSFDGNLVVNKMLVFAQLISIAKDNKRLFEEDMYAFKHGVVVEDIRQEYKYKFSEFVKSLKYQECYFDKNQLYTLELTKRIFGNLDSFTLSELTHQFKFWKEKYNYSYKDSYHHKELSIIDIEDLKDKYSEDIEKIKLLISIEESDDQAEEFVVINGVNFYYNPREVELDETLMKQLKEFPAEESAYSFYIDESQGLVIY